MMWWPFKKLLLNKQKTLEFYYKNSYYKVYYDKPIKRWYLFIKWSDERIYHTSFKNEESIFVAFPIVKKVAQFYRDIENLLNDT